MTKLRSGVIFTLSRMNFTFVLIFDSIVFQRRMFILQGAVCGTGCLKYLLIADVALMKHLVNFSMFYCGDYMIL